MENEKIDVEFRKTLEQIKSEAVKMRELLVFLVGASLCSLPSEKKES